MFLVRIIDRTYVHVVCYEKQKRKGGRMILAMICVNGSRECTGCMACAEPVSPRYICDGCGGWILRGEEFLRVHAGMGEDRILCSSCVEEAWDRDGEE